MKKRSITIFTTALAAIAMLMPSATHADGFANGGFETLGGTPALNWQPAANGYSISNDAFSGSNAAELASAALGAAVVLQDSVADGGLAPLIVGSNPLFSFQAKGFAGTTGNVLFALRYLDGIGNVLSDSNLQFFQGSINPNSYTLISYDLGVVPVGAVSAFVEFSQGIGPINGVDLLAGSVLIDDVVLTTPAAIPEPASAALLGLSGVGLFLRRRRRS